MGKRTVLVTGGAGYIGSIVNKMLNEAGFDTVVVDNLSSGCREAVTRGELYEADFGSRKDLKKIFSTRKFDAVMHFGASIDVGESLRDPRRYYRNNVSNTLNLLDTMLEFGVKTVVFSSTAAVYGLPDTLPISEEHPCRPINPYGKSKRMVEEILEDYDGAYGLRYCCLRYFNAAGGDPKAEIPNRKKQEHNLIPLALHSVLYPGRELSLYGSDYPTPDGTCIRDYIHLSDLGTAHLLALGKLFSDDASCIYNLGNGSGFSVREVINAVERVTGRKVPFRFSERRAGDPPRLIADASLARKELGWKPLYPDLDIMVRDAWLALLHGENHKELFRLSAPQSPRRNRDCRKPLQQIQLA